MATFEREPTVQPSLIDIRRRASIGSQVVAAWLFEDLARFLNPNSMSFVFTNPITASAVKYIRLTTPEDGFLEVRRKLTNGVRPDSIPHSARAQMGLVTKTKHDTYGNKYIMPNSDFIVATKYLDSQEYKGKLDSEIDLTGLLEGSAEGMREHYSDRAYRNIEGNGDAADIREIVYAAARDSEYWLSS